FFLFPIRHTREFHTLSLHDALPILLTVARDDGFALRDKCRRVKAAAAPDEMARHRAIHASRSLRHCSDPDGAGRLEGRFTPEVLDRKSTRLNSSHLVISYAVFCLKK